MVKSELQVYARIKPSLDTPSSRQVPYVLNKTRTRLEMNVARTRLLSNSKESFEFAFNRVFDRDASQEEVFEAVARPVIQNCLEGYNGTIFAYGQTGSGKTFTMNGGDSWPLRGIIPRVLSCLFDEFERRAQYNEYRLSTSFMEIYNENAYDLLLQKHLEMPFEQWGRVSFFEDDFGVTQPRNLSVHEVQDEQQGLDLLMMGNFIKKVSSTSLNQNSSRSHCVFTLFLEGRNRSTGEETLAKLHLVDLAGSERVSKTHVEGSLLTEAKSINLSLSYLEQVIVALNEKKAKSGNSGNGNSTTRTHIPYRNSLMTTILKDSLGGNCRTVMVATISPDQEHLDETVSTLRFAQRVGQLENEVVKNQKHSAALRMANLEQENEELRAKLAQAQKTIAELQRGGGGGRHTQEKNGNNKENKENARGTTTTVVLKEQQQQKRDKVTVAQNTIVPLARREELAKRVEEFLNEGGSRLEVRSLAEADTCFGELRGVYQRRMKEYVTELSFISEKLHKYDELLTRKKALGSISNSSNSGASYFYPA